MASNPDENNAPNASRSNNGRKSNNGSNFARRNWHGGNRNTGPRQRPVSVLIPRSSTGNIDPADATEPSSSTAQPTRATSYRINRQSGPYHGWQLYFPETGENIRYVERIDASKI